MVITSSESRDQNGWVLFSLEPYSQVEMDFWELLILRSEDPMDSREGVWPREGKGLSSLDFLCSRRGELYQFSWRVKLINPREKNLFEGMETDTWQQPMSQT